MRLQVVQKLILMNKRLATSKRVAWEILHTKPITPFSNSHSSDASGITDAIDSKCQAKSRTMTATHQRASNLVGISNGRTFGRFPRKLRKLGYLREFMARKLKTFETSLGFYDLAIAAPSMKAALEAWGADSNLFHQGAAKISDDPSVIAATMKKPGVVLRRPVGSDGSFGKHAELPTDLGGGGRPTKAARKSGRKAKEPSSRPVEKAAEREATLAYEREQRHRERERAREEAARQKEHERRQEAVAKAQAALDKAEREHAKRAETIRAQVEALENRSQAEDARWDKEKQRLEAALRRVRS